MRLLALIALLGGCAGSPPSASPRAADSPPATTPPRGPTSDVRSAAAGDRYLAQTIVVAAPLEATWDAFTTSEGYRQWAAPVAEVDLRAGGSIRAHYQPDATLGDPGTIELVIVNYVPQQLLTLKLRDPSALPESLRAVSDYLYNVVTFEALSPNRTRVVSYGLGYRAEHEEMIAFFIDANEQTLVKLRAYVEGVEDIDDKTGEVTE